MLPARRDGSTGGHGGFSFLEILVALAILTLVLSVIIYSQVELIRARERVVVMEETSYLCSRIAARVWIGYGPQEAFAGESGPWKIEYAPVAEEGSAGIAWDSWTITPSNQPSLATVLYLKPAGGGKPAEESPGPRERGAGGWLRR